MLESRKATTFLPSAVNFHLICSLPPTRRQITFQLLYNDVHSTAIHHAIIKIVVLSRLFWLICFWLGGGGGGKWVVWEVGGCALGTLVNKSCQWVTKIHSFHIWIYFTTYTVWPLRLLPTSRCVPISYQRKC